MTMADTIRTRHTVSGVIDENTPRHIFEHEVLGKYLVEVDEDGNAVGEFFHVADEVIFDEDEEV